MASLTRFLAPLAMVPLFAFTGNKPDAPDLPKAYRDKFTTIPAGVLATDAGEVKVTGFMLSATEVSNAEYRAFVADVREQGDQGLLARVLPDTTQWLHSYAYNEPYREYYYSHPAYASYPVVNVSHDGALAYCAWLQDRLNKDAPADLRYEVRLPSRTEWWYAANGGQQHVSYAWGGPGLRNAKGCVLANFRPVGEENMRRDPATGKVEVVSDANAQTGALFDGADITAPVDSYVPNAFGLFNMNGNVAEMLTEPGQAAGGSWCSPGYDVRNESVMTFNGPSPEVGFRVLVQAH